MKAITEVLKILTEEKERNLKIKERYEKEIIKLPKGSLDIRKKGSREYLLFVSWCNEEKKTISKYMGNISEDKTMLHTMRSQIEERRQLEKSLRDLEKDLEVIDKMLKLADKRITQYDVNSVRGKVQAINENKGQPPNNIGGVSVETSNITGQPPEIPPPNNGNIDI